MTKTDKNGLVIHFLRDGFTYTLATTNPWAGAEISRRGQTLRLTDADIESSRDRTGNSLWTLSADEQVQRWGKQFFALGTFPDDELTVIPGTPEWDDAYEAARRSAWQHPEGTERNRALAALREKFGPPPVTSKTLGVIASDEERQRILEREGLYYADEK